MSMEFGAKEHNARLLCNSFHCSWLQNDPAFHASAFDVHVPKFFILSQSISLGMSKYILYS